VECAPGAGQDHAGFDPLPGVVILELRGAQVAERGVRRASVVDLVNEAGKIRGDVLECFVVHKVDGFDLQRLDEAFGLGVRVIRTPPFSSDPADPGSRAGRFCAQS
jgi:hypothetical protein